MRKQKPEQSSKTLNIFGQMKYTRRSAITKSLIIFRLKEQLVVTNRADNGIMNQPESNGKETNRLENMMGSPAIS